MLWAGLFVVVIGGVLLYLARKAADRVLQMKATETSTVSALRSLIDEVRKELGGGPSEWRDAVELKGHVGCERPIQAEMSGQPAVVVRGSVVREVEELREEEDSDGNVTSRWVSRTETVNNTSLETPFWLDDGTGKIDVRPGGASFTLQKVVDRFEPAAQVQRGASITFGSFSFQAPALSHRSSYRVKGYRFTEEILPVGAKIYALGEVSDTNDGTALHKPQDKSKAFLLSTKSEEEMVGAAESQAKWMKIGGIAAIGLGVVLIIFGALELVTG